MILYSASSSIAQQWNTDFGDSLWNSYGTNVEIASFHVFNDNLYVSGGFEYIGIESNNFIAKWDSTEFVSMDGGLYYGAALDMTDYQGSLYVGGNFQGTNGTYNNRYLSRWDEPSQMWKSVGNLGAPDGNVLCFAQYYDTLYVGGGFDKILPENYDGLAGLQGSVWGEKMLSLNWAVDAMCVYNDELYIGGFFNFQGTSGEWINYLGRWNGTEWKEVGDNFAIDAITSMYVDTINNFLYVSGGFLFDGDPVSGFGMWDGEDWHKVGDGIFNSTCLNGSISLYRGDLFIGGHFTQAGGSPANFFARWNGETWTAIGNVDAEVVALAEYKDELYVGGYFTTIGGQDADGLARYYEPPGYHCSNLQPRVFCNTDTAYLEGGTADVQFYNNNAYSESWLWDFGDGITDTVQNPIHTFTADTGTYNVCVTVEYEGCIKDTCKNITILNYTDNNTKKYNATYLSISPNPAKEFIKIKIHYQPENEAFLQIVNSNGKLVRNIKLQKDQNEIKIMTNNYRSGNYFCNLIDNNEIIQCTQITIIK